MNQYSLNEETKMPRTPKFPSIGNTLVKKLTREEFNQFYEEWKNRKLDLWLHEWGDETINEWLEEETDKKENK